VNIIARAQQWAHTLGNSLYQSSAKLTAIMDIKTVSVDLFCIFACNYSLPISESFETMHYFCL